MKPTREEYAVALKVVNAFKKEEEIEDIIDNALSDIEIDLLDGAYEPSERGAGYCASDSGRKAAKEILVKAIQKIREIDY
jgi:hypothetical protein